MMAIPLRAVPNQTLQAQLGSQACTLNVRQLDYGLFIDVFAGGALIVAGVLAQNLNRIVRSAFAGDLTFFDTQGEDDPVYTGFGTRFLLVYLAPEDLPRGEA